MYRPITPADNLLSNKKITLLKIKYILRNIESFSVELISNKKISISKDGISNEKRNSWISPQALYTHS